MPCTVTDPGDTGILSSRPSQISEKEKQAVDNSNPNRQALMLKMLSVGGQGQDGDLEGDILEKVSLGEKKLLAN